MSLGQESGTIRQLQLAVVNTCDALVPTLCITDLGKKDCEGPKGAR